MATDAPNLHITMGPVAETVRRCLIHLCQIEPDSVCELCLHADGEPWGLVTVERWMELKRLDIVLHVIWGETDVTRECVWADDDTGSGSALLLLRNAEGRVRRGKHGGPRSYVVRGITIRPGPPFDEPSRTTPPETTQEQPHG